MNGAVSVHDAVWLAALPLYALVTTLRHEGSHALALLARGGRVRRFVFWPTYSKARGFLWGYVLFDEPGDGFISAAPYLCDLALFLPAFAWCWQDSGVPHAVWLNAYILGVLSPLANSAYNYGGGFFRNNDVRDLKTTFPPAAVHACFLAAIALYTAGACALLFRGHGAGDFLRLLFP